MTEQHGYSTSWLYICIYPLYHGLWVNYRLQNMAITECWNTKDMGIVENQVSLTCVAMATSQQVTDSYILPHIKFNATHPRWSICFQKVHWTHVSLSTGKIHEIDQWITYALFSNSANPRKLSVRWSWKVNKSAIMIIDYYSEAHQLTVFSAFV